MMLDRMEGNAELKTSVQQMLATRRLTHSCLLYTSPSPRD